VDNEIELNAINELKSMALKYLHRGKKDKAAELLHLASEIELRLNNVVEMSSWNNTRKGRGA